MARIGLWRTGALFIYRRGHQVATFILLRLRPGGHQVVRHVGSYLSHHTSSAPPLAALPTIRDIRYRPHPPPCFALFTFLKLICIILLLWSLWYFNWFRTSSTPYMARAQLKLTITVFYITYITTYLIQDKLSEKNKRYPLTFSLFSVIGY